MFERPVKLELSSIESMNRRELRKLLASNIEKAQRWLSSSSSAQNHQLVPYRFLYQHASESTTGLPVTAEKLQFSGKSTYMPMINIAMYNALLLIDRLAELNALPKPNSGAFTGRQGAFIKQDYPEREALYAGLVNNRKKAIKVLKKANHKTRVFSQHSALRKTLQTFRKYLLATENNKFEGTNSTGILDLQSKIKSKNLSDIAVYQAFRKTCTERTSAFRSFQSHFTFFGLTPGRTKKVEELYQLGAQLPEDPKHSDATKTLESIANMLKDTPSFSHSFRP